MAATEVGFTELERYVGKELGVSDWHLVTQKEINAFAECTHDHQWIHVDVERAANESPFGTTIAHGYYTLSLAPYLLSQIWQVNGLKMGINYGINRLRFPHPVPVGKKVRASAKLDGVEDVKDGKQVQVTVTFEIEGVEKPACVAEALYRYYA